MRFTRAGANTARAARLREGIGGLIHEAVFPIAVVEPRLVSVLWSALSGANAVKEVSVDQQKYIQTKVEEFASTLEDLNESEVPQGMDRGKLLKIVGAGGAAGSLPPPLGGRGGGEKKRGRGGGGQD